MKNKRTLAPGIFSIILALAGIASNIAAHKPIDEQTIANASAAITTGVGLIMAARSHNNDADATPTPVVVVPPPVPPPTPPAAN